LSLSYPISLTNAVGSSTGGHIIFLFAGSDDGGERAAAIYTLTGTAKLNGLDPELYLRQVLERIADHPINRIAELLRPSLIDP
jgi:IS66 C-terminal element